MKKVLIGTVEIAGYFGNLATGLRQNGYDVTEVYFSEPSFDYSHVGRSKSPRLFSLAKKYRKLFYDRQQGSLLQKFPYYLVFQLSLFFFFIQSLLRYQVFIFGFGISLFQNDKDLKWLRRFGKTVISNVALGSEARPPYIDGARRNLDGSFQEPEALIQLSRSMKSKLEQIEKNSSFVIGAPLTSQFLEKPFINLFQFGLPYPEKKVVIRNSDTSSTEKVKILHSPSSIFAKGTLEIRKAIASLVKKGYEIDYLELSNKSNLEILEAISTSDIIVDQVYSDTAMATFATEASFFGKPAVVGGYGWDELRKFIPSELFPPSQICAPEEIETTIEKLISSKRLRIESGINAQKFVSRNWESKIVGKKFSSLIENEVPDSWYLDPSKIFYTHGIGISEEDSKKIIRSVIKIGGEAALCLENKSRLKQKFIDFASN